MFRWRFSCGRRRLRRRGCSSTSGQRWWGPTGRRRTGSSTRSPGRGQETSLTSKASRRRPKRRATGKSTHFPSREVNLSLNSLKYQDGFILYLFWRIYYIIYRVTRRVFSKSVTSKLHLLFQKILAGSLKTLKVTRISAMYTNFSHPPVHSGPSKFSRPKIWNWSLGNTKANKNLVND